MKNSVETSSASCSFGKFCPRDSGTALKVNISIAPFLQSHHPEQAKGSPPSWAQGASTDCPDAKAPHGCLGLPQFRAACKEACWRIVSVLAIQGSVMLPPRSLGVWSG